MVWEHLRVEIEGTITCCQADVDFVLLRSFKNKNSQKITDLFVFKKKTTVEFSHL